MQPRSKEAKDRRRSDDDDNDDDDDDDVEASDFDSSSSSESDDDWDPDVKPSSRSKVPKSPKAKPRAPRGKRGAAAIKVPYKATVKELAQEEHHDVDEAENRLAKADAGVLERIRKALALAQHPNTGEHEARQALRLSTRLMQSQNLSQADIMAKESAQEAQQRAGQSTVVITSTRGKTVPSELWSSSLAGAICTFFDVKCWSQVGGRVGEPRTSFEWTFYGLAVNTVAAAMGYEMVFNQALQWAAVNPIAKGRVGKNSYLNGMSDGLRRLAKKEKEVEKRKAIEAEKKRLKDAERDEARQVKKELDRLKYPKLKPSPVRDVDVKAEASASRSARVEDAPSDDDDGIVFVSMRQGQRTDNGHTRIKQETKVEKEDGEDEESDYDDEGGDDGGGGWMPGAFDPLGWGGLRADDGDSDIGDEVKPDFDEAEAEQDTEAIEAELKPKMEEMEASASGTRGPGPSQPTTSVKEESSARSQAVKEEREVKTERTPDGEDQEEGATWESRAQLTLFRDNAARIADDYLQKTDIKLRKGRAFTRPKRDAASYAAGVEDSKRVDVRRRRIE